MRRLNVQATQLEECVRQGMHALPSKSKFEPGELLLLQLTKSDARADGKLHTRIEHVLEFDRLEHDADGSVSRRHWPDAGRTWPWIVYGRTLETLPFSLADLPLSQDYDGQVNARRIEPVDEAVILPYVVGQPTGVTMAPAKSPYASPIDSKEVDELGMAIAMEEVRSAYPGEAVTQMEHNHEGFDILVGTIESPVRFVEVKSTRSPKPVFNISEAERKFSVANAGRYSLLIITGIDLKTRTHRSEHWYVGEVDKARFKLSILQWRGEGPLHSEASTSV